MSSEPQGLSYNQSNTFLDNKAKYGKDFSSSGSSLSCGQGDAYNSTGKRAGLTYNYDENLDPINISVRDFYGQLYPLANLQFVEAQIIDTTMYHTSCLGNSYPQIIGETISRFDTGLATFDSIIPTCYPGFFNNNAIQRQYPRVLQHSDQLQTLLARRDIFFILCLHVLSSRFL
jgi:hypothetical protein